MSTIDLLNKAVSKAKSERALSLELGLDPAALANARYRGKLSGSLAIVLAEYTGENLTDWAIQAHEESERSPAIRRRLTAIKNALNS